MKARTASEYFGAMVDSYDSLIRRAVPRYDEMIGRLVEHLPARAERVLELGCGTGNLTLLLAARYPGAAITTVDASPEMTKVTQSRVEAAGEKVTTRTARFEELRLDAGAFDLVTSSMSLHHVKDKVGLYREMAAWLTARGMLAFADQFLGATPEIQSLSWEKWREFCRQPGNCTERELTELEAHAAAHDHYVAVQDHFAMLREVGFARMDCVWRSWMYGVVVAVK